MRFFFISIYDYQLIKLESTHRQVKGEHMSKRKHQKINSSNLFKVQLDRTLIRPKNISIQLENRGKDFKLDYKETFNQKEPPANHDWTMETTLNALARIKEDLKRHEGRYFYYQAKPIKKGYELMIVSDDAFALVTALFAELLAFGIREKEDAYNCLGCMP